MIIKAAGQVFYGLFSFCMNDMLHDTDGAAGHQPRDMAEYKPGDLRCCRGHIMTTAGVRVGGDQQS